MIKGYELPAGLGAEIDQLEELIKKYKRNEISLAELKPHRVPFGVYEQREAGTYMVRVRCAAGFVNPEQLKGISAIALEYGVGDLHITSRQELQIHYVKLEDIINVIRRLKEIGLSTRGGGGNTVRNIAAQVDAGIDPEELFDVSLYASALTTRLIAESDSWNLPRKFKIAFSGSAQDKGYATISDVGFIAKIKGNKKGFRVYAAGGMGAKSSEAKLLLDFIEADEVYAVTKALKNIFFKYGNRRNKHAARMRFLWQSLGEEEFKKRFSEEYEKIKSEGFKPLAINEIKAGVNSTPGVELTKPGSNPRGWNDAFSLWQKRFVKPQKQPGFFSVLVPVELGFISCSRAQKLAEFLGSFGSDVLRLTKDQNFLLRNIPQTGLAALYNFLVKTMPDVNQPAIFGRILSCAGASTCQLGICLSRQAAWALIKDLKKSNLDLDGLADLKINISGCPNSCGHHPAADLGFSGKASRSKSGNRLYPAYNVFIGAVVKDNETKLAEHIGEIPAKALPLFVKDYLVSKGKADLKEIILKYSKVPEFETDKSYYYDWGRDALFSLAQRGAGECSAGFFDLLEMDLNNMKHAKSVIELVFFASRALLVTRGVDAKNEEEVYAAFLKYFIDAGLIDSSFRDIIAFAQDKDLKALEINKAKAKDLAKAVEALYETMDNNFNFTKTTPGPQTVLDLRGVKCPMNFVKTKIGLSQLKPTEILEVLLDDGEPIENVPGSIKAEGHNIIAQKKIDGHWSVVIEKR